MDYEVARDRMIKEQILKRGIDNERVLIAMGSVPRHLFVDQAFWPRAYGEYPLLAFQLASDYLGVKKDDFLAGIPVDDRKRMIIKWAGKWKETFKHYSYIDIITSYQSVLAGERPRINLEDFRGNICLVGLTAAGLHDIKPNPLEATYPALGINANIINNLLNKDFIKEAPNTVDGAAILILGILMSLAISRLRPVRGILFTILPQFYLC